MAFVFGCLRLSGSATETFNYKTGLIADSYSDIEKHLESQSTRISLPTRVDKTANFPTPGDQGQQNSCVGWAVGYALKSSSEFKKRGWTVDSTNHMFSPAYIYNQINEGNDNGASILDALELMKTQGVCTLPYFPYNANNYTKQPTAKKSANANLYKVSEYHTLLGIENIKEKIYQNYGVVIGIKIYPDFKNISSSNKVYDSVSGTQQGQHAICLIGYDDTIGVNGAFKFINSWGTDWGVNGYGWISYDTVKSASPIANIAIGYYIKTGTDDYVMGDLNDDGAVTTKDAVIALDKVNNGVSITSEQFVLADVNGDATVTTEDAQEILSVASGIQSEFSLYQ